MSSQDRGSCEVAEKVSGVRVPLNKLDNKVSELEARLGRLQDKMKPSLLQSQTDINVDTPPEHDNHALCPLATEINALVERLEVISQRMENTIERCEL